MRIKDAIAEIGCDLSKPSKMPGYGYSLPAHACLTGSKLAEIPGTPCHKCYAMRGNYLYPSVRSGLTKRLEAIENLRWVEAMTLLIRSRCSNKGIDYFRWFDSGDLQSSDMLSRIIAVCNATPDIQHWLPTQERTFIAQFNDHLPDNLCVRISTTKVGAPPALNRRLNAQTSTVNWNKGFQCGAQSRGNQCGPCRACWDKSIPNVNYPQH